jgi:hypothetical protein
MCTASALLAVLCLASSFVADEPNSQANEQVRFDGQTLGLAFEGEDPGATIREYLPAGEKLDNWTRLAAIRRFEHLDDPVAYAEATIKQLKQKYPQSPSAIVENAASGAVVLDFVVWPDDASFVEFNVFRYEKRPGGGLISQQYAVRAYGDKAEPFLMGLRDVRQRLVEKMAGDGLRLETKTSAHKGPSE